MTHRLGVVAVVPFWSQSDNLNVDSNYAYLRVVLPEMSKQSPDTLFLVFFPNPKYGADKWNYTPDKLQSDRIRFIPWPYDTQMQMSVVGFSPERFREIERHYGPTIYWLHQVEMGNAVATGYYNSYSAAATPTLVAQHHYIIHRSLPYQYEAQFRRQWLQIGGSLVSDRVLYNSDHCLKMARESFSEYLITDKLRELDAKTHVLKFGLLSGQEPVAPVATKDHKPVVVYNHRFEHYKQPELTFDLLSDLRQTHELEVWVTQAAGQKIRKSFFYDKVAFAPSRAQYLRNIAVPAINTINSVHETFCISLLDSLALGHLVVAPNAVTFPELVPDDYPFLFNSTSEQRDMLDMILYSWPDEYNKWRERLIEHTRSRFALDKYVSDYLDHLWQAESAHRDGTHKDRTLKSFETLFDQMKPKAKYAPLDLQRALGRIMGAIGGQSMPTRRIIREAMILRNDIGIEWSNGVKLVKH